VTGGPTPRVVSVRDVPPDPTIAKAVGRHHTLSTAVADLVDNSIDAAATQILVRFIANDGAVIGLRVIDDGRGMDSAKLDEAMTFAKKREYGANDLGHFGIGLKAASLSQADVLRVYSQRLGAVVAGRQVQAIAPTSIEVLDNDDVAVALKSARPGFAIHHGTIVEWAQPRTFLISTVQAERDAWLDREIESLLIHLGITFHRLIAAGKVAIGVDVFDLGYDEAGAPREVKAIDPFGAQGAPGSKTYPLAADVVGERLPLTALIWPAARSGSAEFRLFGKPGSLFQGLFVYRNDRLLTMGGWYGLVLQKPELEYARIALDLSPVTEPHVSINPEKAGIELDATLQKAILKATGDDGASFAAFLDEAQGLRKESRKYQKHPVELAKPDRGFGRSMLDAFAESVKFYDAEPVDIRWRVLPDEVPVKVNIEKRTIELNTLYRSVIAGHSSTDSDDAPLVKTLLMLVYSRYFDGSYLGSAEKEQVAAWEQLLTAALREELAQEERRIRAASDENGAAE